MKQFVLIISVFLMSIAFGYGQNITYEGKITDLDTKKSLSGVTVKVLSNGAEVYSFTTSSNGSYSVQFASGKAYTIDYSKPGYISKIIKVDVTKIYEEDLPPGGKIFPPIDLDLFADREGADFSFLKQDPVVEWFFDGSRMNFNPTQVNRTKKKIIDRLEEAAKAEQQIEVKYNALIQEADLLYKNKSYKEALDKYVAALKIPGKQTEEHPNNRLLEIEDLLQKQAEEELKLQQENQAYQNVISAADALAANKEYDKAIAKYNEASEMKPYEQYPKDKIAELKEALSNAVKRKEYEQLIVQADDLFKQDNLKAAADKYEAALKLIPEEGYPKSQLTVITDRLKAQSLEAEQFKKLKQEGNILMAQKKWAEAKSKFEEAANIKEDAEIQTNLKIIEEKLKESTLFAETEKLYTEKIKEGVEWVASENYEEALKAFKEALDLKPNDVVASTHIADVQQKIAQKLKKEESEARYKEAIEAGKKALNEKDYSAAIKFFDDALIEKPLDSEATKYKDEAKKLIKNLQSEEQQYADLLSSGQTKLDLAISRNKDIPTFKEAKAIFEEAQKMRPNASLPQNKIIEIDEMLRQFEEQKDKEAQLAEDNRRYEEQLELASVAAQNRQYEKAIDHLKSAALIKPDEEFPKNKIKEYEALWNQMSVASDKEKKYAELISKADLAFDNRNYDESILLYNEALAVKENEAYPLNQIESAKKAKQDLANNRMNQEYQNLISRADEYFAKTAYEDALKAYEKALEVKKDDTYAKDKIDETQQIINNQAKQNLVSAEELKKFKERIDAADKLFNQEDYIAALKEYEKALEINKNDVYAINRAQLSIQKSKEKTEEENNIRYQKILIKADEYFDDENFEKAIELYERALSLRKNDAYPASKIAEITAIQNSNIKVKREVEYLGEQSNISILEGAALLEAGEKHREMIKRQSIEKQLQINEGAAKDRSARDDQNRIDFNNEVIKIIDNSNQTSIDEGDKLRVFIDHVDNVQYEMEMKNFQNSNFERGEVLRMNQNIVYINDEMNAVRNNQKENHTLLIEQLKDIKEARDDRSIAEANHHKVKVTSTREELLEVEKKYEEFIATSEEIRKDREVKIDDILKGKELRTFEEGNLEYRKVQQLQSDALLAELKVSESHEDKLAINEQLQDDIYALDAALQRKINLEGTDAYENQLLVDSQLASVKQLFAASQESKDEARKLAVEQLKVLDAERSKQAEIEANQQYKDVQNVVKEVEIVQKKNEQQEMQQRSDLVALNEEIKAQERTMSRANELRNQSEEIQRQNTVNEMNLIKKQEELARDFKNQQIKDNHENLKGLNAGLEGQKQMREQELTDKKFKTQELLDQLENNRVTFTETIANTLGDEYPEGVSQENYIRKDKDGIPVKIVTRRFVVKDGRGDVYIRVQTRNGLTYSKNGTPVTEQSWINGTENALLEKHY